MSNTNIDWVARSEGIEPRVRNFVGGRWREGSGPALEKYAPRDGKLLCRFRAADATEVEEAVAVARKAFEDGRWSLLSLSHRKAVLEKLATLIEAHREELALLECLDVGKPIGDAWGSDVPSAARLIKHCAATAEHAYGKVYAADRSGLSYELRRPLGVVAGIVGWNFPIVLAAAKIGPALMTGNSLVLKPSELTSLTTARLAELAIEAGVPEGVFNVIHGSGAVGTALAHHPDIDLVSFTGSTQTGKLLLIASGQSNMKRLVLECGGKAPSIIFDDAPSLDAIADRIVGRAFWNQGQVCTASSRILVQESIKQQVLDIIIKKVAALRMGDPLRIETRFAALVSRQHQQKVLGYAQGGQEAGARVVHMSKQSPPFEGGFYVPPTVFDQVSRQQPIAREEIFGPLLAILTFRNEAEAIEIANDTIYGLSAILWTRDLGRAHRVTLGVKAGWISVNATGEPGGGPGVGIMSVGGQKQSGLGVEGGVAGLEAYMSTTAVQFFV